MINVGCNMILSPTQTSAIEKNGKLLISAAAGSGKTRVMVEKIIRKILHEKCPVTNIFAVTFTEAAASEIKERIKNELKSYASLEKEREYLEEQIRLLEIASIGTLHSFCLKLTRKYFYVLGLAPDFNIASTEEADCIKSEVFSQLLEDLLSDSSAYNQRIRKLLKVYTYTNESNVKDIVFKVYEYSQTLPEPKAWLDKVTGLWQNQERYFKKLKEVASRVLGEWLDDWALKFRALKETMHDRGTLAVISETLKILEGGKYEKYEELVSVINEIKRVDDTAWSIKKHRKPFEKFFNAIQELNQMLSTSAMALYWEQAHEFIETIVFLTNEFSDRYAKHKRELNLVDFSDLEHFALRILTDDEISKKYGIIGKIRRSYKHIFVDEYQDINEVQDRIIQSIYGSDKDKSLVMVGDIKQCIYRFRLANPNIFRLYEDSWLQEEQGCVIRLNENYRSHEEIVNFANKLFSELMNRTASGIDYAKEHKLKPAAKVLDNLHTHQQKRIEIDLILQEGQDGKSKEEVDENIAEYKKHELEAYLAGMKLKGLVDNGYEIFDKKNGCFRKITWNDMVILLRSPSGKAEYYAKVFSKLGIPIQTPRTGFYESIEIKDLINLLKILDNPLQDIPLVAVLRSPLIGLSLEDLCEIRRVHSGYFWNALKIWLSDSAKENTGPLLEKVTNLISRFNTWRQLSQQNALVDCLAKIISETDYIARIKALPNGEQRVANINKFFDIVARYSKSDNHGLKDFVRFLEHIEELRIDIEPAPLPESNAVRLMSIHQSKGLEYPIVVISNLDNRFNFRDLTRDLLLNEEIGICPKVYLENTALKYKSLAFWIAEHMERRELIAEELRIFYVGVTRASNRLILVGCGNLPKEENNSDYTVNDILYCMSPFEWILRSSMFREVNFASSTGTTENFEYQFIRREDVEKEVADLYNVKPQCLKTVFELTDNEKLRDIMSWQYPFKISTQLSAKYSVSELVESDEHEAFTYSKGKDGFHRLDLKDIDRCLHRGIIWHRVLEKINLSNVGSSNEIQNEIKRLCEQQIITPEDAREIDPETIYWLWSSEVGQKIISNDKDLVKRELQFTSIFLVPELSKYAFNRNLTALSCQELARAENDFIIVQGIADLVVLLDDQIWLLDYKTGSGATLDVVDAYKRQITIYGAAMEKVFDKPVTNKWLCFLSDRQMLSV
jgi:ATP-dependent helicase/nuclease subunit A